MSLNIELLGDQVLIEQDGASEKSEGGIVLVENDDSRPSSGRVVAVGPGRMTKKGVRIPIEVGFGNAVLFKKYSEYTEINLNNRTYLVMRESDVLAVKDAV